MFNFCLKLYDMMAKLSKLELSLQLAIQIL